jgi:hypothetical protein
MSNFVHAFPFANRAAHCLLAVSQYAVATHISLLDPAQAPPTATRGAHFLPAVSQYKATSHCEVLAQVPPVPTSAVHVPVSQRRPLARSQT